MQLYSLTIQSNPPQCIVVLDDKERAEGAAAHLNSEFPNALHKASAVEVAEFWPAGHVDANRAWLAAYDTYAHKMWRSGAWS